MKTLKIATLIMLLSLGSVVPTMAVPGHNQLALVVLEQVKKEVAQENLPEAIQVDVAENYSDASFKAAYELTDAEGLVVYEVHLVKNENNIELRYNADGEILK